MGQEGVLRQSPFMEIVGQKRTGLRYFNDFFSIKRRVGRIVLDLALCGVCLGSDELTDSEP